MGESTSFGTRIGATSQDLGARNSAECMTDVGFQEFRDIGLQPVASKRGSRRDFHEMKKMHCFLTKKRVS